MKLRVHLTPNARTTGITSWDGDVLRIRLHAPPIEGRANRALCQFLGALFQIPPTAITLLHGSSGKQKLLDIPGDRTTVHAILQRMAPDPSRPDATDGIGASAPS